MGPANGGPVNLEAARLQDAFLRFATLSAGNLAEADFSGADLVHARFDDADLSAANLSNANLDHADFAGANLKDVNLSGASLRHAKNLTQAQLEESIGSDSTILPLYLEGFVSWSARTQTKPQTSRKLRETRSEARQKDERREINAYRPPVREAGVLLLGAALVLAGFVWWGMNDASQVASDAQKASEPSVTEPKLSLAAEVPKFQPGPLQAVAEQEPNPEQAVSTNAVPGEQAAPSPDSAALVPPVANAEPQASETIVSAEPAIVAAPDLPGESSDPSVPLSIEPAIVAYRPGTHGTAPDTMIDAPDISAPAPSALPSTVPDSTAAAARPDHSSASVSDTPTQSLGLATPPAAPLSEAVTPSAAAVPFSDQKATEPVLPHDAASIPMPVRKPVIETSVAQPAPEIPKPGKEFAARSDRSRLAKGLSMPRSRSKVCVPVIGRYYEGRCSN